LAKKGAAYRIGRGKYAIIPADVLYGRKSFVADPFVVISELMKDVEYYVAYQSAAHIHGIAEQVPFSSTVAVLKQKRPVRLGNTRIEFVTMKKSKFFGFNETKYSNVFLKVSDLEKTVIDCIDRQDLCGGISEVARTLSNALSTDKLDLVKLLAYAKKFSNYALIQRLGFLLERLSRSNNYYVDRGILSDFEKLAGPFVYPLDVSGTKKGRTSEKWRIIENISLAPTRA
jgi:predicted transcriptional regulator of viral defense system